MNNTPDTEKCEHNVVGKYCFRCKRPDLACRCNCLNFYKIECDCPCHPHVEIEQNAETGEVLTANGIDLTPQQKGGWEEDFELCFRYFFMDMADGAVKHDIKCFIRTLLSSRDTYWKNEIEKAFKQGQEDGAVNRGERRRIIEQIREKRDTYWKEGFKQMIQKQRQIKISDNKDITDGWNMALLNLLSTFDYPNAITNEDNLK